MIQNPPPPPIKPTSVDDSRLGVKDLDDDNISPKEDTVKNVTNSNIVTLKPYAEGTNDHDFTSVNSTRTKHRRRKYKVDPTLIHFDTLFGNESWSRYLVFKTETEVKAAKLENILLTTCATKEMSFRPINKKEWLVETTTKQQSEIYQSLNNIDGIEITVQRHDKLNSIEGTVILPPSNNCDGLPEERLLLESLKLRYPNVEGLKLYEIPSRKQAGGKLRIARIKFEGHILPSDIKIEGQKRELLPYLPKPLQCKNCSKYGHTHNKCRNPSKCAFCGSEDHKTTWNCGSPKCLNCGQNHHARSKTCPFYIYNTELKLLISRSGMSILEAKLELKSKGFIDPARNPTYRDAVRGKFPSNAEKVEENNTPQSPEISDEIKLGKDEIVVHVPVSNSYEILTQDDEEIPTLEIEMEEEIDMARKKRLRDQNSPPKVNENSAASKKRIVKLNRQTTPESDLLDEITPSPVYQSKYLNIMKNAKEKQESKMCECQQCSEEGATPEIGNHHERCGCNNCFTKDCKETKPLTKDKLLNIIRNFMSRKDSGGTSIPLELHPEECMCIKHLHYYRVNKTSVLDNFLAKQDNSDTSSIDTETSKSQTENKSTK